MLRIARPVPCAVSADPAAPHDHKNSRKSPTAVATLTLGALGVVYGDIGTSPLYALKEVFSGGHVADRKSVV